MTDYIVYSPQHGYLAEWMQNRPDPIRGTDTWEDAALFSLIGASRLARSLGGAVLRVSADHARVTLLLMHQWRER